jgi:hypothetical protein
LVALGQIRPPDLVTVFGVGGLYKVGRDLHVNLALDYWGRMSSSYAREYSGARSSVSITYGF